jgi:hypothetical protein
MHLLTILDLQLAFLGLYLEKTNTKRGGYPELQSYPVRSAQFDKRTIAPFKICKVISVIETCADFPENPVPTFESEANMFGSIIIEIERKLLVIQPDILSICQSETAGRCAESGTAVQALVPFMFIGKTSG